MGSAMVVPFPSIILCNHRQLFLCCLASMFRGPVPTVGASTDCPGCSHCTKNLICTARQPHTIEHTASRAFILPLALFVSGRLVYQLSVCCLKMVRNKLQRLPQSVICACLTYRESNSQSVVCETLIH